MTNPEDDDVLVDEAWLLSVGFKQNNFGTYTGFLSPTVDVNGGDLHLCHVPSHGVSTWHVGFSEPQSINITFQKTRGQLRLLCKALSIHLKETIEHLESEAK